MMRKLVMVGAVLGCVGCASMQKSYEEAQAKIKKSYDTSPVCKSKLDCDSLMEIAQGWIAKNSRMKIQTATSAVIETYNDPNMFGISFRVTKEPITLDSYKILLKSNALAGDDAAIRQEFNDYLNKFLTK